MSVIQLTAADWRNIFPRAPKAVIDAFASPQGMAALEKAGILGNKTRLAYALANVEHECGGFTIPGLTENIHYTAGRMAQVWPNRFSTASAVMNKYGSAVGWQKKAFDDIYGNRMGNRPGTSDGSLYIGRGGPQVTGRDGYKHVGDLCGLDLVANPELASKAEHQPAILAAFWTWKKLNPLADAGQFEKCVRAWNGGTNGMADRQAMMSGNQPIIARLAALDRLPADVQPKAGDVVVVKPPVVSTTAKTTAGAVIAAGTAAAGVAWYLNVDWFSIGAIGAGALLVAAVIISIARRQ